VKKCCKPFRLRTHWFTAVRRGTCFQAQRTNLSDRPSPELVRSRVILLCRVSSSEFLRSYSRPMPLRIKPSCRGFVPHRDNIGRVHSCEGFQSSLRSVLRHSQPLDGLLRAPTPQAYSIPQPRPGPILLRGFFLDAATLPRRKKLPPWRWGMITHRKIFGARNHIPRLRGLDPHRAAFLRSGD